MLRAAVSVVPMPWTSVSCVPCSMSNELSCRNRRLERCVASCGDGLVEAEDPIRHRENQLDEPADSHPARKLAAGVAPHAVGDDHGVADFLRPFGHFAGREAGERRFQVAPDAGHDEVIFVAGSHLARVRTVR